MKDVYSYRMSQRRLTVWTALAVFVFLGTFNLYEKAPWFIWSIWLPSVVTVLYLLIKNPVMGGRLTRDRLILSAWQKPRELALRDIAGVTFISWSDGADMEVRLNSGDVVRVFSGDIPPIEPFRAALSRLGVPVAMR